MDRSNHKWNDVTVCIFVYWNEANETVNENVLNTSFYVKSKTLALFNWIIVDIIFI